MVYFQPRLRLLIDCVNKLTGEKISEKKNLASRGEAILEKTGSDLNVR
jgi:hypothetical protein